MELTWLWVLIGVIVVIGVILGILQWSIRGGLQAQRAQVDEAWGALTESLGRRADLVPELIESVRGYAAHEKPVFDAVASARAAIAEPGIAPGEAAQADGRLQGALKNLYAVAEAYPQLQASPDFLALQAGLADADAALQASRRSYNGAVREFNAKIGAFPNRVFARRLGLGEREFFEATGTTGLAEPPRVQF